MRTIRLLCWAIWHLCTTPFVEFYEVIKAIRWLDARTDERKER